MRQVVIGKHPYTFARVSAMKAKLIRREEYQRIIRMSLNEVTSFIQEGSYKSEVDELAVKYKGITLLELALNKNLFNTIEKLKKISKENLRYVIQAYLIRNDMKNTKAILRAKYTGSEDVEQFLLPSGVLSQERIEDMIKAESVEQVLEKSGLLSKKELSTLLNQYNESGLLIEIETALDRIYFRRLAAFSDQLPRQGKLIREFLRKELVIVNIVSILRLKRAGVAGKDLEKYVIPTKTSPRILKAAMSEGFDELQSLLKSMHIGDDAREGFEELKSSNSLVRLETDLYRHLLKDSISLLKRHPLSVDVILGYLFAKEIEIRNLKMIIKAKQLGMEEQFMEEQLVA